jgi:hypothetical protein
MKLFLQIVICGLFAVNMASHAAMPEWLSALTDEGVKGFAASPPAVVLLDSTQRDYRSDGTYVEERRIVIRILNRSGCDFAEAFVPYEEAYDVVQAKSAWLMRDGKEVVPTDKRKWIDFTPDAFKKSTLASQQRAWLMSYTDFVLVGDVFAYSWTVERKLLWSEDIYIWSARIPVLQQYFKCRLPVGWDMKSLLIGPKLHDVQYDRVGQHFSWFYKDHTYRASEPAAEPGSDVQAKLFLDFVNTLLPSMSDWPEVVKWCLKLHNSQCDSDQLLSLKVRELTADSPDRLSKVRALFQHAQSIRYAFLALDFSKGDGCKPRKATEVFRKGWGDCKDKANLLRAMLREINIESWPVLAHTEMGRSITPDNPSAAVFNHVILAVSAGDSDNLPSITTVPKLGKVVFLDPTDSFVSLGDLPASLQGSKVLVLAEGNNELTTLPFLKADPYHLENRKIDLVMTADGSLGGRCEFGGLGEVGAYYRNLKARETEKDFHNWVTGRLSSTLRGVTVLDFKTSDDLITGSFKLECNFAAKNYAQMMPGGMVVARLDVLSRLRLPVLSSKERVYPIQLGANIQRDDIALRLPPGLKVDEAPVAAKIETEYGRYESTYAIADGVVNAMRRLEIFERTVPVSDYAAVKKFFADVVKADRASIVLRKIDK